MYETHLVTNAKRLVGNHAFVANLNEVVMLLIASKEYLLIC